VRGSGRVSHLRPARSSVDGVDNQTEVREFLASRRAKITPEQAGVETFGGNRRVPGRNPYDKGLTDLVGELSTRSEEFRTRWAAHNVRLHRTGIKHFHHPLVGDLELAFDAMELPAQPGLTLTAYSAEPGSPSEGGLKLLASWAATNQHLEKADTR
jgi:transcription regulator MmyB-like protein